jgi:hypothetical protein
LNFLNSGSNVGKARYSLPVLSRKGMPETNSFQEIKAKSEIKPFPILATLGNDYKAF